MVVIKREMVTDITSKLYLDAEIHLLLMVGTPYVAMMEPGVTSYLVVEVCLCEFHIQLIQKSSPSITLNLKL